MSLSQTVLDLLARYGVRAYYAPLLADFARRTVVPQNADEVVPGKGLLAWDWLKIENLPGEYDMYVLDGAFFEQFVREGALGLGESFIHGHWMAAEDQLVRVLQGLSHVSELAVLREFGPRLLWHAPRSVLSLVATTTKAMAREFLTNRQSIQLSQLVAEQHYDLPNELYRAMLDPRMQYSCGFWSGSDSPIPLVPSSHRSATNTNNTHNNTNDAKLGCYPALEAKENATIAGLEQAQLAKMRMIADKLLLKEDDELTILDIGCGWGYLAVYLGRRFPKCRVLGISISKEQVEFAQAEHAHVANVSFLRADYRDPLHPNEPNPALLAAAPFGRIVSVGCFEHIGRGNYARFFGIASRLLAEGGLFLLHTIVAVHEAWYGDRWIDKYVFPGGQLSSVGRISNSATDRGLVCEDVHCFGPDYARTLHAWTRNFQRAWPRLRDLPELRQWNRGKTWFGAVEFYRMWSYYLAACRAGFNSRAINLAQIVLSKNRLETYTRPAC